MFLETLVGSEWGRALYYTGSIDMHPPLYCIWGDVNPAPPVWGVE